MKHALLAAVGILAASSGPVLAQPTQTARGAQQFLDVTFDRGVPFLTWSISPEGISSPHARGRINRSQRFRNRPTCMLFPKEDLVGRSFGPAIAWYDVLPVNQSGSIVTMMLRNRQGIEHWQFDFGSEEIAVRAAYAMEFLRQACDPAAGTGF